MILTSLQQMRHETQSRDKTGAGRIDIHGWNGQALGYQLMNQGRCAGNRLNAHRTGRHDTVDVFDCQARLL